MSPCSVACFLFSLRRHLVPSRCRGANLLSTFRPCAGVACSEALLAECDAVSAEERSLWARQDALSEGLPQALAEAFQRVDADFASQCKARFRPLSFVI